MNLFSVDSVFMRVRKWSRLHDFIFRPTETFSPNILSLSSPGNSMWPPGKSIWIPGKSMWIEPRR
jgi:hypothetical protein